MKVISSPGYLGSPDPDEKPLRPLPLLQLPLEIRRTIYEYYYLGLPGSGDITVRLNGSDWSPSTGIANAWLPNNHALLLVNSQVSAEAQQVLYSQFSFNITEYYAQAQQRSTIHSFLTQTNPENRNRISRLTLDWNSGPFNRAHWDDWMATIEATVIQNQIKHDASLPTCLPVYMMDAHTVECDRAFQAAKEDLGPLYPLFTRVNEHILDSLRELENFKGLKELSLTFPTPNLTLPTPNVFDLGDREGSGPLSHGTIRPCGAEWPFFSEHIDDLCEILGRLQGVRWLRLHHVEDLPNLNRLAIAMGVFEVAVEYRCGYPFGDDMPPQHWFLQEDGLEYKGLHRLRRKLRPWTEEEWVTDWKEDQLPKDKNFHAYNEMVRDW